MAADPNFAIYAQHRATEIPALAGRVDIYASEEHTLELASTDNPIESGATLTDHAVERPRRLTLSGWVADLLPRPGVDNSQSAQRGAEAWERIGQFFRDREPVEVVTTLGTYRNMLIEEARAPVDASTGRSLKFELKLKQVLWSETATARVAPAAVAERGPAADRTSQADLGDQAGQRRERPAFIGW